ncbi:pyridoxal phosphate-dependent aminotransferase [Streptomyces prunicolor]|uniref:Aminotransferase n=1 Tax=Streptomyces prunicolor TaxID=67348 RepID=A0ABU4FFK8_9ACTN|nr:pyridoxal phosphate-dependent aminotransferase [Streptomyces prunicolor]MCX5243615.1 pyridoxal phosphate-dependent aminotransferase [Streptomyces prunicolor]MDV7219372.1 pyridoxal phosphate-dependent aminotransferase [Streptomyces prunicolor]
MDTLSEASSIRLNNRIYEMQAAGMDVITLSLGEAFFDIPVPSFEGLPSAKIHHYSHSRGVPLLREKLAKYQQASSGAPVDPEREIMVTAGSKAAIVMAFTALLEPGDEVIIPEPMWVSYPDQVRIARGVPVMTPWYETVEGLASYITPRTRAIVVNNPHNPSGRRLDADALRALHELADRHGLFLIADEAYHEFVANGSTFVSALEHDPGKRHTIVCNSMSKNYGISGWRIGYMIANAQLTDQIIKLQQHMVTCAPTILCYYLAENFETIIERTRPQIQRVVGARNRMAALLAEQGVECLDGDSTFYLFASLGESRLNSEYFAERLLHQHGVGVVPGIGYGPSCDRFVRISVGTESDERLVQGISALASLVHETR